MLSIVTRTVTRAIYPFIALFGAYVILHGHLTPGGGFPGGVLVASSIVVMVLAFGASRKEEEAEEKLAETLETDALLAVLGIFLFLVLLAKTLPGIEIFGGAPGTLFSGGIIPLFNIGSGIEVTAALLIIFLSMLLMRYAK